jgi:uncharacterized protein
MRREGREAMNKAVEAAPEIASAGAAPQAFAPAPFVPRRFLSNGHLQTIVGNFLPRADHLPAAEQELIEVSPATQTQIASRILCLCHWQPKEVRAQRPAAIIVHGLEGSSESQYVVGNAYEAAKLTPTLYHSGLSGDVDAVMRFFIQRERLESIALIGYSMGGNLVLKLAGELSSDAPRELRAVVGVSPAMDLDASSTALHRPINRVYERRFLRAMLKRYRNKVRCFPRAYDPNQATGIRSLRDFDERITALYSGYSSAEDYYYRVAAARVVDRIAVPTLILHSLDDPFVVLMPETVAAIRGNPHITFVQTEHGGHCAFLAKPNAAAGDDGYWAEQTLLRFVLAHAR